MNFAESERAVAFNDVESCVEATMARVGRRIRLGTPLGLGKANHIVILGSPLAQQQYVSSNYTHVVRDLLDAGINVLAQLVAST